MKDIKIIPIGEISMGGPWTGKLVIDEKKYEGEYFFDDIIYNESFTKGFVIRYFRGYFLWQCYKKILIIDIIEDKFYLSKKKYNDICIESVRNGSVYFYNHHCTSGPKAALNRMQLNLNDYEVIIGTT